MDKFIFDINEVTPHLAVQVEVRGMWRWRLTMCVVRTAARVLLWIGADVSIVLRRKP